MHLLVISLLSLFVSLALLIVGNSFLITLLGLRFSLLGIEPSIIGVVMVCYSAGFAVGSLYADRVVRRVGHIRAFAVFAALAAMASLIYPMTYNVWHWGILRGLGGLSIAALFVTIESWFSAVATNANRSKIFSVYQIAAYLASASGQLLVGLGNPIHYALFSLAALFIVAAIIPLSLSRMQSPEISESTQRMSLLTLVRLAPIGVTAAFGSGILLGSFFSLVPLFASQTGLETAQISYYMFGAIFTAMLFAWPIGWICDRFHRSSVLMTIAVLAGIASLGNMFLVDFDFVPRLVVLCLYMGLASTVYSIAVAITNDMMDSSQIMAASSGLLLSYGLGSVAGPLLSSSLMELLGPASLFQLQALVLALLAGFTLYRRRQVAPMPVAAQEHYIPSIPESPVIPDIDPRHDGFVETPLTDLFPTSEEGAEPGDEGELMPDTEAKPAFEPGNEGELMPEAGEVQTTTEASENSEAESDSAVNKDAAESDQQPDLPQEKQEEPKPSDPTDQTPKGN